MFKKESLKVYIRGVLYDVNRKQYKRGITEAIVYQDDDGFILWSTVHGSGKINCELNLKLHSLWWSDTVIPDVGYVDNPRYKGYSIVGSVLSECQAFELIDGC